MPIKAKKAKKISAKRLNEISETKELREQTERDIKSRLGWEHCLHPDTELALDHVDSAIFTGCPSETRAAYNRLRSYVERWTRELDIHKKWLDEEKLLEQGN